MVVDHAPLEQLAVAVDPATVLRSTILERPVQVPETVTAEMVEAPWRELATGVVIESAGGLLIVTDGEQAAGPV